jgi:hypothetical protein
MDEEGVNRLIETPAVKKAFQMATLLTLSQDVSTKYQDEDASLHHISASLNTLPNTFVKAKQRAELRAKRMRRAEPSRSKGSFTNSSQTKGYRGND